MDFRERFAPPSRPAFLRASWLWAPVAVLTLAAKVHKFSRLGAGASWSNLGPILAQDVLWLALVWLLSMAAFDQRRRWLRLPLTVVIHLAAAIWGLLTGMEHAYFTATGAVADGYMIKEMLTRWKDMRTAVASELSPARIALMCAPIVYSLVVLPLVLWFTKPGNAWPAKRRLDWRASPMKRWVLPAAVGPALALPCLFVTPADVLSVLERNAVVGATREVLDAFSDEDALWANFAVKTLPPLTLKRVGDGGGAAQAKNVIVITLESVSAKATSLYGVTPDYKPSERVTPFMEKLAASGARVERAYTVVPHTSKALVAIHCGVYPKFVPPVVEAEPGAIPSPCLARLLREQGFATAFFQPAEENYEGRSNLVAEFGFETFIGKESLNGKGFDEASYFGWEDDVLIGPLTEWALKQHAKGKPFFAGVLTLTSHHPYAIPKGYPVRRLVGDPILNDYLNTVAYTDRFLERLFASLEAKGLLKETLVIVSGDHGEAFGEHGRYQHDTGVYEENARVPMIAVGPGIAPGTKVEGLRQIVDVLPTALERLGFEPSRPLLGASLLGEVKRKELYLHCYFQKRCRALLEESRKTIDNYQTRGLEVFDLEKDPFERENLFGTNTSFDHEARSKSARMDNLAGETNALYVAQSKARRGDFVFDHAPKIGKPLSINYGAVEIVAAEVAPSEIDVGGRADVTLVYHVKSDVPPGYRTFMHLVSGKQWFNADHDPVGGAYPVSEWRAGDYIVDRYTVTTRPEHPLGRYDVRVGFWTKKDGNIEPVSSDQKIDGKERVHVGEFTVTGADVALEEHVFSSLPALEKPVTVDFGEWIRIRSVAVDKPEIKGGLKLTVNYVFEVLRALPKDARFDVHVRGPSPYSLEHVPVNGDYPLSQWKAGEFIADPHGIITKTRDRAGKYTIELKLTVNGDVVPAKSKDLEVTDDGALEVGTYIVVPGSERR
jgi:lipoteichoic acid synthase